jgi:hypothetical protein
VFWFVGTTFLIFFLTVMYLLSLGSLAIVRLIPALSFILWVLPVKELPIGSIGLMAGMVLFIGLSIAGLLRHALSLF